jgi:multiple antibiotic resistance protein
VGLLEMENALGTLWTHFALGFSALLPLINPLGTALVIVGLVGLQPPSVYQFVARKVAVNTVLFLAVVELVGSYVLEFFGISMAIVQFAGGIVVMAIGWGVLNQKDADNKMQDAQMAAKMDNPDISAKMFYPLTFPVTVGPGGIVVMLTLSAHASESTISENVIAHLGLMLSVVVLGLLVYLCYAYAPGITRKVSPSTAHGIVRVIAFILLCIGAQIAWRGLEALLTPLLHHV